MPVLWQTTYKMSEKWKPGRVIESEPDETARYIHSILGWFAQSFAAPITKMFYPAEASETWEIRLGLLTGWDPFAPT